MPIITTINAPNVIKMIFNFVLISSLSLEVLLFSSIDVIIIGLWSLLLGVITHVYVFLFTESALWLTIFLSVLILILTLSNVIYLSKHRKLLLVLMLMFASLLSNSTC